MSAEDFTAYIGKEASWHGRWVLIEDADEHGVCIHTCLFTLSMTVEEARELATKLQNAAVQAAPMVNLEDAA